MSGSQRYGRPSVPPLTTTRGFSVREAMPADHPAARRVIMRVLEEDLKTGYRPEYHWDLDDMSGVYLGHPRQALFVAIDDGSGDVIGTMAVRREGPKSPPHPQWIAERYAADTVAQLMRAYIAREHRRRGVARTLVEIARQYVVAEGGYETIYLHTNPAVPEAEPFWRAMPTREIYDSRVDPASPTNAVHFELELRTPVLAVSDAR